MMTGLQKSQKMENQTIPDHLDGLQNIGAKVEHQHQAHWIKYRTWYYKKKKKKKKSANPDLLAYRVIRENVS